MGAPVLMSPTFGCLFRCQLPVPPLSCSAVRELVCTMSYAWAVRAACSQLCDLGERALTFLSLHVFSCVLARNWEFRAICDLTCRTSDNPWCRLCWAVPTAVPELHVVLMCLCCPAPLWRWIGAGCSLGGQVTPSSSPSVQPRPILDDAGSPRVA